jgi:hypothetical protein
VIRSLNGSAIRAAAGLVAAKYALTRNRLWLRGDALFIEEAIVCLRGRVARLERARPDVRGGTALVLAVDALVETCEKPDGRRQFRAEERHWLRAVVRRLHDVRRELLALKPARLPRVRVSPQAARRRWP